VGFATIESDRGYVLIADVSQGFTLNPSAPIRDYLDALVHPSAREDALVAVRHRAFMAPRLFGSLIALGIFPVFLAIRGVPSALEFVVLAWLVVPIATAYFLSRTGRYDGAHMLSALALTGIVTIVAANSGGINSFAAIWLVLIPLEATVSGSRRVVAAAALLAIGGAALLMLAGPWLDTAAAAERSTGTLAALGIVSAALYATGIALGADSVARANSMLLGLEEERCRLLAGNMTDVITRHDQLGRVLFASPNAEAVFGVAAAELQGTGLIERIHVADRATYMDALAGAAATGETGTIAFRLRERGAAGRNGAPAGDAAGIMWVEMRCRPFDGRAGTDRPVSGPRSDQGSDRVPEPQVVAVMRDVTKRKVEEEALIAARAEAERANAAKSRFLAVMSHELRTPLNAIIGFSDMLRNESEIRVDAARRQEYARLINESGYHLLAVVNDILDMSRLETGDFEITSEPFRLGVVMAGCSELLALKAQQAGVTLTCIAPPALPDIVADKRAIKQILINLISNAIKFTDLGGTVTVGADQDGQHILLTVEDTGIGIAPDDLARLGNPFFQARGTYARKHDGTGLGLSIVKGLVKLHGGSIDIKSSPGEGTRIEVRLPIGCEGEVAAGRAPTTGAGHAPAEAATGWPASAAASEPVRLQPSARGRDLPAQDALAPGTLVQGTLATETLVRERA
jgi:two-component system, cell cycle sensor histidine kinase DivJ